MIKKVAILTQPLHDNYGGLLQAYALKEVLKKMGHQVVIINRLSKPKPWWRRFASRIKRTLQRQPILTQKLKGIISQNNIAFKEKYITELSHPITSDKVMQEINNMGFDILLVGSDQCWRPKYSPQIFNYFFDFAKGNKNIQRISYAASFGVSEWEFTSKDTVICKELLQKFDAISIREDSAIELVRDYLGRDDAVHVLDPTFLLSPDNYMEIIENENIPQSSGELKVYILDWTEEKVRFVEEIAKQMKLNTFEVLPLKLFGKEKINPQDITEYVFPSPAVWLRGFQDSQFVITDSFHGVVFSILFNVPFLAIGNKKRGLTRFTSLLKVCGLEDRLIVNLSEFNLEGSRSKTIDWPKVNTILEKEKVKSYEFLKKNLG